MEKAFVLKPSVYVFGKGLDICSGEHSGDGCNGESGSSMWSSPGLLGATGLFRISAADMR